MSEALGSCSRAKDLTFFRGPATMGSGSVS